LLSDVSAPDVPACCSVTDKDMMLNSVMKGKK